MALVVNAPKYVAIILTSFAGAAWLAAGVALFLGVIKPDDLPNGSMTAIYTEGWLWIVIWAVAAAAESSRSRDDRPPGAGSLRVDGGAQALLAPPRDGRPALTGTALHARRRRPRVPTRGLLVSQRPRPASPAPRPAAGVMVRGRAGWTRGPPPRRG